MERMRVISAEPPLSGRERLPRYDLFQRKDKPDLHCAVPKSARCRRFCAAALGGM